MRGQRDAYTFLRFTAKNCSCIPSGRTIREVAKRFMVTKRTVHRLVQQYKQTQDLTPKKVGTKRVGILEQNKVAILAIVEEYPDKCLWQYVEIIGERLGIHVSISTLHSFLKKHKITLKKRHSAVKKPRVKLCRNNA
jgi:Transposase and inactivated derivatives